MSIDPISVQLPDKKPGALTISFSGNKPVRSRPPPPTPTPIPTPTPDSPTPAVPFGPTVEKRSAGSARKILFQILARSYHYNEVKRHFETYEQHNTGIRDLRSKGFILLKNLMLEIKSPDEHRQRGRRSRGRDSGRFRRPNSSQTSLVVANDNRFLPSALSKNIGMWNSDSDEAFKMSVNQTLNRLTDATVGDAVQEIHRLLNILEQRSEENMHPMDRAQRVAHVVTTIVNKASREQAFVSQYAMFAQQSQAELQAAVVSKTSEDFYFSVANSHESDPEDFALTATGSARFFAALAANGVIPSGDYCEALVRLMREIHAKMFPARIEMLLGFVLSAGPIVIRDIGERAPQVWTQLSECMARRDIKRRLFFMFVDVDEKRREWIEGQQRHSTQNDLKQRSNEAIGEVRNAFTSFCDSTEITCTLPVPVFLRATLELYLDHARDHLTFCNFICTVLEQSHANPNDVKQAMLDRVRQCRELSLENDCPKIWPITADLMYLMLIKGLLLRSHGKIIREMFPDEKMDWNAEDGMKWFLHDARELSDSIFRLGEKPPALTEFEGDWSKEIRDALLMPQTLEAPPPEIPMSRLIAIALIRSIQEKLVILEAELTLDSFAKWRELIRLAFERQGQTTRQEMEKLVEYLDLPFEVDDIYGSCMQ
jgi:hypothetical protein